MNYALIDLANSFWRCKHIASKNQDPWTKVGMALHLTLASVNQAVRMFNIDHVCFMTEGRSWRKNFYQPYKANRVVTDATEAEQEENKLFWETYETFINFLNDKTNTSVLRCSTAEADDLIARFIHLHPTDNHYIISTDTDFVQLISENVQQYNGVTGQVIRLDGYFDDRNKPVKDKKTGTHKLLEEPEYLLFKKIVRGDSTDNVFSAYPGAREKGSKNSVGIKEAFEDRNKQGFNFNNFMLQKWQDHNGIDHRVKDDYERNRILIDLTAQPDDIKKTIDESIIDSIRRTTQNSGVGLHLLKFCGKHELIKISEQAETYAKWLNKPYSGELLNASER